MDRNSHTGKSKLERERYRKALKIPMPPQPTIDENIIDQTDKEDDSLFKKEEETKELRKYTPKKEYPIKEIVIGLIIAIVSTLFTLVIVNINREVGTLFERVDNSIINNKDQHESINNSIIEIRNDVKEINSEIKDIQIDVEVIKQKGK